MNKALTKQYFTSVVANQDGILHFIRMMPNNITTCKLIEQTLEDNGYEYIVGSPSYKEKRRAEYITNRNDRARRMYIVIWSDCAYDYNAIDMDMLANPYSDFTFPCTYLTSRNAKKATLQVIEVLNRFEEEHRCKS